MRLYPAVVALLLSTPSHGGEPTDWVRCDGLARPIKAAETIGRLAVVTGSLGLIGAPEADAPERRAKGAAGVDACTAILDSPVLTDGLWARRANVLQARAIHRLEAGDARGALTDLDAMPGVVGSRASDPFFARSIGVSAQLLRALALDQLGDKAGAASAAEAAAAARPFALSVVDVSLAFLRIDPVVTPGETALWSKVLRLDPGRYTLRAADRERRGDWKGALSDLTARAVSGSVTVTLPGYSGRGESVIMALAMTELSRSARIALVASLAGDETRARAELATVVTASEKLGTSFRSSARKPAQFEAAEADAERAVKLAQAITAATEAQLALAHGDKARAVQLLRRPLPYPRVRPMRVIAAAVHAADPAAGLDKLADIGPLLRETLEPEDTAESRIDYARLFDALPAPEDRARLNSYSGTWGLGLKQSGFSVSKVRPGSDVRTITFTGTKSSRAATEEMALLRAAELAREMGQRGFLIVARRDYLRTLQTTMYGSPVGKAIPAGFQTQLDVRPLDPTSSDIAANRVFTVDEVISALGPLYLPQPANPKAAGR